MSDSPKAWSRAQRAVHWTIATLIVLAVPMGFVMVALPFRELLLKFVLYQLHKTIGMSVFLLVLVELTLHWRRGRPPLSERLAAWQRRAAYAGHSTLFVLLLVTPFLGYLTAATAPVDIPTLFLGLIPVPHIVGTNAAWFAVLRRVHLGFAVLLVGLACGHAAMALRHHWQGEDTLVRMWSGRTRALRGARRT